jgi:signal transduction histidine kinase/ligand-binding sensor domain-containing protein
MSMSVRVPTGILLVLLLCLAAATTFGAAEISDTGFVSRSWQTEDGLAQNTITSIIQTRDGYLWIGTLGGLSRFDGEQFRNFGAGTSPGLKDGRISSLFEDAHGCLWIGHDFGGVTQYQGGEFSPYIGNAKTRDKPSDILGDRWGEIWLVHPDSSLESAASGRVFTPSGRLRPPDTFKVVRTTRGDLWVSADGSLSLFASNHFETAQLGRAQMSAFVMGIGAASDGGLWVVEDGRIREFKDGNWSRDAGPVPWERHMVTALVEMSDGTLAVGTDIGLFLESPKGAWTHIDHVNGLIEDWVRVICEDREGDLWIAAGNAGLVELRRTPFSLLSPPDRWHGHNPISVLAAADGALWAGTEGAGIYRYSNGVWAQFAESEGIGNPYVWSLANGPNNEIWAGSFSGGPYVLAGKRFETVSSAKAFTPPIIALMATGKPGSFYAGTGHGLMLYNEGKSEYLYKAADKTGNISTIAIGKRGVIWFGISPGGLGRIEGGKLTLYGKKDGLSSDGVQCLLPDEDDLWIGTTDGGLNRMHENRFSAITARQGLPSDAVCYIADDQAGNLILSTHRGIARVSKEGLDRYADGAAKTVTFQVFDRDDGLPTIEFSGGMLSAGTRASDGRLWFPSNKGLVGVDPREIHINPFIPPVIIESAAVDGIVVHSGSESKPTRLSPNHERIEFQYTALSFAAPAKIHFKYRMDGVDNDWIDPGTKRFASYSHLGAGRYSFAVIASNNDGLWNTHGAAFTFEVMPYYWQTLWFRTLTVSASVLAVALLVRTQTRRRMQARFAQLEREGALERERTRIAQDIHDDIGASLTRIAMLSQSGRSETEDGTVANNLLGRIFSAALEMTRSLDEIVWAINPRHDTLNSLAYYMGRFAQEMLELAGVRCRLDLPTDLPNWHLTTQTRHNLLLAFKEALTNAVRHAKATEVTVSLMLLPRKISIRIDDNGRGMTAPEAVESETSQGEGIANMRLRLAQIGGTCQIESTPTGGTSVCFTVRVPELE